MNVDPWQVSDDAWVQHADLLKAFTAEYEVRSNLRVVADGCDRTVRLELRVGEARAINDQSAHPPAWHTTQRNVGTMRELANALNLACDFVEKANPIWAATK